MSKHKRATNFSKSEVVELIKLVLEKKHIFQNKKTDAVSSRLKDAAWEELAQKFNASSFHEIRTAKVLKEKYNNIKRCIRKEKANRQRELCISPSSTKEWNENDSLFGDLNDVMSVSVDGLQSRYDEADTSYREISDQTELKEEMIEYSDVEDVEEDAEAPEDCDISCSVFRDIDMQMDKEVKTSASYWEEYHLETQSSKRPDLLKLSKTKQTKKIDLSDVTVLKKQILEQQLHHASLEHEQKKKLARLEHEQRMFQSVEEHKIKIKILQAELELKKSLVK